MITMESSAPSGSNGCTPLPLRDEGTTKIAPNSPTSTSGMVRANTPPHQNHFSTSPAPRGPIMPPAPAKAAQTAMALGSSRLEKTSVRMESVAGMMRAAAVPMIARMMMI